MVLLQLPVVSLRPTGQHVGKVEPFGPVIQLDQGPPVPWFQDGAQVGRRDQDFRLEVFIKVQNFMDEVFASPPLQDLGLALRGDQVLVHGVTQVIQVKPTEETVPVGAAVLALPQGTEHRGRGEFLWGDEFGPQGAVDFLAGPEHLLVQVVAFGVFDKEILPDSPPQIGPVFFIPSFAFQLFHQVFEGNGRKGREGPFHHLVVGCGGKVGPPLGGELVEVFTEGKQVDPFLIFFQGENEFFQPFLFVNPAVGARPDPEFGPVIGISQREMS